jgi:ubiquinone/menaquinone biosynthesis C-methylase UbiE
MPLFWMRPGLVARWCVGVTVFGWAVACHVCLLHGQTAAKINPVASTTKAAEQAEEELPPPLTHYLGREIATTMHYTGAPWLVRESRQREEDCKRLLAALKVQRGQTVCDLGCGNGFYTVRLARLVGPEGKVYAVDIQPEMLDMLKAWSKKEKLTNILPILGSPIDPRLPERQIDLVLMVDVYHEFSHPEHMLAAIRKSLKPAGRIAVAEFRAEDPRVPILPLHKMSKEQILKEFSANGFRLVEEFDGLPWQHLLFFRVALERGNGKTP